MNKVPNCNECEYLKMYDYVYKNYYCDNEARTDDMGKLSVDDLPKTSPKWCPLRVMKNNKQNNISLKDIIQIKTDIELTDKQGNVIEVKTQKPEYLADSIF